MAIGPISPVTTGATQALTAPTSTTEPANAGGFDTAVGNALDQMATQQATADSMAQQAATGQLTDVSQYLVAATEAQLTTQLTVAVRNKAVEAFTEIMRMQV